MDKVYVELDLDGKVYRLLTHKESVTNLRCMTMDRAEAVEAIRYRVFKNSGHKCRDCGNPITWATFHMHEKISRGKGGQIGVDNSIALCSSCHIGKSGPHADRYPQFTKSKDKK